MLAAVLALWLSHNQIGAPYITNDGYQYLDAASNVASGQCFCTRVALFDEQIAFGRMPIPFTHFAPGYPLLIAAVSRLGIPAATAGYLLSALGYLAVLWLLWDLALHLGASAWVVALFSLLWIAHATALYYAAMVGTESLFAAALLAMTAMIVRDVRAGGSNLALAAGIGAVAGLSYWIRYPGLFLLAVAVVYLIARAWRIPRGRRGAVLGLVASVILTGAVQIRNFIYTGSWRGGFNSAGRQRPLTALKESIRALIHLLTGDRAPSRLDVWSVLLVLSCAALLFMSVRARRNRYIDRNSLEEPIAWTLFVGLAYVGGIFAATLTTIAGDFPRYYFPVYPLFLALMAVACSRLAIGVRSLAVILFVVSALAVEGRSLFVPVPRPDWILTRAMLQEDVRPGVPLLQWMERRVNPNEVVVAVEGQAVHYILHRPVVAAIEPEFSSRSEEAAGYRELMRHYGSRYIVVFPNAPAERVPEQDASMFLRDLAAGASPPWLSLAARTADAAVYECADCASPQ